MDEEVPGARRIAAGGLSLLAAQAVIACGQVVYSAVTSRILAPEDFGRFAVALAAMSLMTVVLSSGLPTAALATRELSRGSASSLVVMSLLAGSTGALLLLVASPLWEVLWSAPDTADLTRLFVFYAVVAAPAVVQLAFLRREGRTSADAGVQAAAAVVGLAAGILAVSEFRQAWALVVNPTVMMIVTLLVSFSLRRTRYGLQRPRDWRQVGHTAGNVSVHSVGFWFLMNSPTWATSLAFSDSVLGQFSRAMVITALPAGALTTVFIRSLQPYYRHVADVQSRRKAFSDVSILVIAIVVPVFALIAVLAAPLTLILLGPGWAEAASMATLLAGGYGTYLVYSVLTNAMETMEKFAEVRRGQLLMLATALTVGGAVVISRSTTLAAVMLLVIALVGVYAVYSQLNAMKLLALRVHARQVAGQVGLSLVAVGTGLAIAWGAALMTPLPGETARAVFVVSAASVLSITGLLVTARWQPAYAVMRRRGVLRDRSAGGEA